MLKSARQLMERQPRLLLCSADPAGLRCIANPQSQPVPCWVEPKPASPGVVLSCCVSVVASAFMVLSRLLSTTRRSTRAMVRPVAPESCRARHQHELAITTIAIL